MSPVEVQGMDIVGECVVEKGKLVKIFHMMSTADGTSHGNEHIHCLLPNLDLDLRLHLIIIRAVKGCKQNN